MSEDDRINPRSKQDLRRALGDETPPPSSTREPSSTRATGNAPSSSRMGELAQLYRKISEVQAELADTEARLEKALHDSASADEMVGQMLARIGEAEGKARAAQKSATDAEARASELATQVGKARAAQAEIAERLHAAEGRLLGDKQETDRLRSELQAARTEATVAIAAAEEAQDAVIRERDQAAALRAEVTRERAQMAREREERETLRARLAEFTAVCDERDQALAREALLESDLHAAREMLAEMQRRALSGEHRLGDEISEQAGLINQLTRDREEAQDRANAAEKELVTTRRELAEARREAADMRAMLASTEARVAELDTALELSLKDAADAKRDRDMSNESLGEASTQVTVLRREKADAEDRAAGLAEELAKARAASEATLNKVRTELSEVAAKHDALVLDRHLDEGISDQAKATHDRALADLRAAHDRALADLKATHAAEIEALRSGMSETAAQRDEGARASHAEALATLQRERDAAIAERNTLAAGTGRLRAELVSAQARTAETHGRFRAAIDDITRMLAEMDKREAEAARLRAGSLTTARKVLDQAVEIEHALAGLMRDFNQAPAVVDHSFDGEATDPRPAVTATTAAHSEEDEETQFFVSLPRS